MFRGGAVFTYAELPLHIERIVAVLPRAGPESETEGAFRIRAAIAGHPGRADYTTTAFPTHGKTVRRVVSADVAFDALRET